MELSTPPNWPIYGVEFSKRQIEQIVGAVYPKVLSTSITELAKQKSFNNRIYFLSIQCTPEGVTEPVEAVLKIPGRFFGATKIQNEVAVLLLLEKFCPELPVPRVLAWSDDGTTINAIQNGVFAVLYDSTLHNSIDADPQYGWIMMSRLPGRSLQKEELTPESTDLIAQLAQIMASWRTKIPEREHIGNLALKPAGYTSSNDVSGLETVVTSTLHLTNPQTPLSSSLEFYNHLMIDQLNKLRTNDSFASASDLIPRFERFRVHVLPSLVRLAESSSACVHYNNNGSDAPRYVFTHQDFAPRNILVLPDDASPSKLRISGVLDFEFAGFFPETEEFLTCIARQADDWDSRAFHAVLNDLFALGITPPVGGLKSRGFEILCNLVQFIELMAPWHLESGHMKGQELTSRLKEARHKVLDLAQRLESHLEGG